jgi:serine/threonine-protein kinase
MLTGNRLFEGESDSDVIAAVLQTSPDWRQLPPGTPPAIRRLLRRCLELDPDERLHDIADARLEIEEAIAQPVLTFEEDAVRLAPTFGEKAKMAWPALVAALAVGAVLSGLLLTQLLGGGTPAVGRPSRLSVTLPAGVTFQAGTLPEMAVSPDGRWLVFTGTQDDAWRLFKRSLDQFETEAIPGVENAYLPFFSPDGSRLGFSSGGELLTVPTAGGPTRFLCTTPQPWGATWGPDGTIVVSPFAFGGLWSVPAAGGALEPLLLPDPGSGYSEFTLPEFLPDGGAVLYTAWSGFTESSTSIGVLDLQTREHRVLIPRGAAARYLPTGHLIYGRRDGVEVVPFDVGRRAVTGPAVPVPEPIFNYADYGMPALAVSEEGTLFYVPGGRPPRRRLMYVDLEGNAKPVDTRPRGFAYARFSPDGQRLAVSVFEGGQASVWVINLMNGAQTRLTGAGNSLIAVWSADGRWLIFAAETDQPPASMGLFRQRSDGTGEAELLLAAREAGEYLWPYGCSPDGSVLVFGNWATLGRRDEGADDLALPPYSNIWYLPLAGDREPRPFLVSDADTASAAISPDGRWLAYRSWERGETGKGEIYLERFPEGGERHQISIEGGEFPVWSPDGSRLYYRGRDYLTWRAVSIAGSPKIATSPPTVPFEYRDTTGPYALLPNFDIAPDGRRFVVVEQDEEWGKTTEIRVVFNWFDELKRLAPSP